MARYRTTLVVEYEVTGDGRHQGHPLSVGSWRSALHHADVHHVIIEEKKDEPMPVVRDA